MATRPPETPRNCSNDVRLSGVWRASFLRRGGERGTRFPPLGTEAEVGGGGTARETARRAPAPEACVSSRVPPLLSAGGRPPLARTPPASGERRPPQTAGAVTGQLPLTGSLSSPRQAALTTQAQRDPLRVGNTGTGTWRVLTTLSLPSGVCRVTPPPPSRAPGPALLSSSDPRALGGVERAGNWPPVTGPAQAELESQPACAPLGSVPPAAFRHSARRPGGEGSAAAA